MGPSCAFGPRSPSSPGTPRRSIVCVRAAGRGRVDEASRAYEAAIEIEPENIGIQHNYAAVKPFAAGDRRLARLEQLYASEDQLSDDQRMVLHFTLGKAYADLKDADRSFRHIEAGNRLKRQQASYDERGTLLLMQRIRDAFSK